VMNKVGPGLQGNLWPVYHQASCPRFLWYYITFSYGFHCVVVGWTDYLGRQGGILFNVNGLHISKKNERQQHLKTTQASKTPYTFLQVNQDSE